MGQLKKHGNYRRYINEVARGNASVHQQRLRSVMNLRERQENYRTRRNVALTGVQGMAQQRLESLSVQEVEPQRNNYISNHSASKFVSGKHVIRDLRASSSQPSNLGLSHSGSPAGIKGGPSEPHQNIISSANVESALPITLPKRKGGPRITNVQAHIVASKQLYLQLHNQWNQAQPVDNIVVPHNHQLRFIEAIRELQFDVMNQVILKEVENLSAGCAQIQVVERAVQARENCIRQIVDLSQQQQASMQEEQRLAQEAQGEAGLAASAAPLIPP